MEAYDQVDAVPLVNLSLDLHLRLWKARRFLKPAVRIVEGRRYDAISHYAYYRTGALRESRRKERGKGGTEAGGRRGLVHARVGISGRRHGLGRVRAGRIVVVLMEASDAGDKAAELKGVSGDEELGQNDRRHNGSAYHDSD